MVQRQGHQQIWMRYHARCSRTRKPGHHLQWRGRYLRHQLVLQRVAVLAQAALALFASALAAVACVGLEESFQVQAPALGGPGHPRVGSLPF